MIPDRRQRLCRQALARLCRNCSVRPFPRFYTSTLKHASGSLALICTSPSGLLPRFLLSVVARARRAAPRTDATRPLHFSVARPIPPGHRFPLYFFGRCAQFHTFAVAACSFLLIIL